MASGVPTCIQVPSSRKPNSRSCSLARVERLGQRKFAAGCAGEDGGRHDRNAGIDERNDLMFPALAQRAIWQHRIIAVAFISDAAGGRRHQKQNVHARRIKGLGKPRQIRPHAIDPQRIGIEMEERRLAQSAAAP